MSRIHRGLVLAVISDGSIRFRLYGREHPRANSQTRGCLVPGGAVRAPESARSRDIPGTIDSPTPGFGAENDREWTGPATRAGGGRASGLALVTALCLGPVPGLPAAPGARVRHARIPSTGR